MSTFVGLIHRSFVYQHTDEIYQDEHVPASAGHKVMRLVSGGSESVTVEASTFEEARSILTNTHNGAKIIALGRLLP